MKTVILDGYGMNPGDMSWKPLEDLVELTIYDRTAPDEILSRCQGAEGVLTNKVVLTGDIIRQLPELRYIGILATGINVVDIEAATECGITVTNIPAYSTESVAQMVFAHLLTIVTRVEHYTEENRNGRWCKSADFVYWDHPLQELFGKKFGIIGLGNIGRAVARIATAFGMKVFAFTSKSPDELPEGVSKLEIDEIFSTCDVVSLHCPLNDSTYHLVNKKRLDMMKPSAIIINTGRGQLVDDDALAEALNSGKIYAAGLDVLSTEPPRADNPLLYARNCFVTPHIAWATKEARERLQQIAVDNLKSFIEGHTRNQVNRPIQ
ncbi:MAG: D-2-hydroxyacid dehydrogenase [Muribaculaceae bacterium]|nr:D-2-hydroxyacid dehydrogenase [Muribaculaceae bacterium]